MISTFLSEDERLILQMYSKKKRKEVIYDLELALPHVEENIRIETESTLKKLKEMDDDTFNNLDI